MASNDNQARFSTATAVNDVDASAQSSSFTKTSSFSYTSSSPTNGSMDYPPYSDTIPPPELPGRHRTLVLCFDGTGDQSVFYCQ